ncbi:hypothetical protein ElyMa_000891500 [Elysia marginata]|uniref:Uncharacterized protein n=1 Tax=Elysia marginata TaxID=1093978 RepID=A0AAV4H6K0_9GAST|nr:hypothetical protein ElyMa_000891500 [Elysia marginata]
MLKAEGENRLNHTMQLTIPSTPSRLRLCVRSSRLDTRTQTHARFIVSAVAKAHYDRDIKQRVNRFLHPSLPGQIDKRVFPKASPAAGATEERLSYGTTGETDKEIIGPESE